MDGEAAPSGADLDHAHAGFEIQLCGGVNEFVVLCLFQRIALGIAKLGAGILHVVVEEEPIQFSRHIVVMPRVFRRDADRVGLMPAP